MQQAICVAILVVTLTVHQFLRQYSMNYQTLRISLLEAGRTFVVSGIIGFLFLYFIVYHPLVETFNNVQ